MTEPAAEIVPTDLTESQRWVLSVISRVNLVEGVYAGWVNQLDEKLDKNSLYALERRGVVDYDRHRGKARVRNRFVALASACRESVESAGVDPMDADTNGLGEDPSNPPASPDSEATP